MAYTRETCRFHVKKGPESLFDRVRHIMAGKRTLSFHGDHVRERTVKRDAPIEEMIHFNSEDWTLMTAEVDKEKGKFVNSAWQREINGNSWWIVIGFGDKIMTVIETNKLGLGKEIVREGKIYKYVDQVNKQLMEDV